MPGSQHRALKLTALVAAAQAVTVLFATRAVAEPSPTPTKDDPCSLIAGPAKDYCERGEGGGSGGGGGTPDTLPDSLDPLSSLAKGCADAAAWTVDTLSDAVKNTADVDFTNGTFLKQYAVVFAASTILTLILWLLAVAKRAVRGVPLTTALSEAVGFLWLTVLASAFTPLILYTVVSATDAVTDVLAKGTGDQTDTFFGTFSQALEQGDNIGGGPIMLILVSFVSIIAAGVLYLELYLRAVLLYVGALLGVVVYAGLVDKNLWGHVRRWAGIMIAVIMVKPVIVIVLGLAGALTTEEGPDSVAAIVSGLAIILLAIFASAMIYRFVPGFGDEIANGRNNRIMQGAEGKAAAVMSSPANLVAQGIRTHSTRGNGGGGGAGGGGQSTASSGARPSNPASGGVAAHSSRPSDGGGNVPSAAPAPRSGSPVNTPHARNTRNSGTKSTGGDGR
ncbi:energy-coupling factor transporter transmembrane protein EcfT [Streptomyces sp. AC512_CC834]|uniref:energy-coupling factor transporter transmembrane protein EcfT n=1 Tax=Streptomyces sp. AC512_CC834 TaxID=2823691 RepID=UPI001C280BC0|nr:energy-coupling factor transporter transmembrane protein EcfT [Streptomyces sp. AC512_CC834]